MKKEETVSEHSAFAHPVPKLYPFAIIIRSVTGKQNIDLDDTDKNILKLHNPRLAIMEY